MILMPKRILIVDDEEDLTWSISRNLTKDNNLLEIICVNSGDKAREMLNKFTIDLVISDIRMPGTNGLDLLAEIKENYPNTKVIIMTAYGTPEIQEQVTKNGSFSYYVEKPFDMSNLKKIIFDSLKETSDAVEERLVNVRLRDILLLNCLSKSCGALKVLNGKQKGMIYFNGGEIVHAQCGSLIGESALFSILDWDDGTLRIDLKSRPFQQTITRKWESLLGGEKKINYHP